MKVRSLTCFAFHPSILTAKTETTVISMTAVIPNATIGMVKLPSLITTRQAVMHAIKDGMIAITEKTLTKFHIASVSITFPTSSHMTFSSLTVVIQTFHSPILKFAASSKNVEKVILQNVY